MSPRDLPPPSLGAEPFALNEARAAGLTVGRLRHHDCARPFHGVRMLADANAADAVTARPEQHVVELARAYAPRLSAGQFFSHTTASALWGIPLPMSAYVSAALHDGAQQHSEAARESLRQQTRSQRSAAAFPRPAPAPDPNQPALQNLKTPVIHVSAAEQGQGPRTTGVVGHRLTAPTAEVTRLQLGGRTVLVSTPEAAWLQLCALGEGLTHADLVAAGDYVVREPEYPERGRPFGSRESLGLLVDRYRGRGKLRATEALAHIRQGSDARPESLLRLILIGAGLPEPELNPIICDRAGQRIGRADLVFRAWRVIVEYDGNQHRTLTTQYEHDMWRLERYTLSDWSVLRIRATGLFVNPEATVRHVRAV